MKKWICVICIIFIVSIIDIGLAQIKQGASPATIGVNSIKTFQSIPFPYNTRDLIVQNNDSTAFVYVDVMSSDTTSVDTGCFLLGPDNEINLYDYVTSGISILYDNGGYSTDTTASPISILAIY